MKNKILTIIFFSLLPLQTIANSKIEAVAGLAIASATMKPSLQNEDDTEIPLKQWYQVEVFVFANNQTEAGDGEQWPVELGLKYPQTLVTLKNTSEAPALIKPAKEIDPVTPETRLPSHQDVVAVSAMTNPMIKPLRAFEMISDGSLQLSDAAQRISREYNIRPLFHKAWRQTVNNRATAESILITGGEKFDQHFELEGSIKISVERYLHIDTHLWLNHFISNAVNGSSPWPLLPVVPNSISEQDSTSLEITLTSPPPNTMPGFNSDAALLDQTIPAPSSSLRRLQQPPQTDPLKGANAALATQLKLLNKSQYSVERTVVMRQHRRMRSSEIHYIDHPLFGLLIRIDPYREELSL